MAGSPSLQRFVLFGDSLGEWCCSCPSWMVSFSNRFRCESCAHECTCLFPVSFLSHLLLMVCSELLSTPARTLPASFRVASTATLHTHPPASSRDRKYIPFSRSFLRPSLPRTTRSGPLVFVRVNLVVDRSGCADSDVSHFESACTRALLLRRNDRS